MCGIVGKFTAAGTVERGDLERMCARLLHRGPDEGGVWCEGGAGLAMRRLKIIDLVGGQQPMANTGCPQSVRVGPLRLVFNGEIYNHLALRGELEKAGHRFASRSDTEVILHLFEEHGEDAWKRLAGMFAIALWEEKSRRLHLVRDRLGIKPLYLARTDSALLFASEVKALLADPAVSRERDSVALDQYFSLGYVPAPRSAWRQISKVAPGEAIAIDWPAGEFRRRDFWDFHPGTQEGMGLSESLTKLDALLRQVVREHLISDVPLGLFLSGGLDSATVAFYAREAGRRLDSFTIYFDSSSFSERREAALTARRLDLQHHEEEMRPAPEIMERLGATLDEPLADPSILPTHFLCALTRQRVTVALSGDGGDELFAGYTTYIADAAALFYRRLPEFARSALERLAGALPASFDRVPWDYRLKAFLRGAGRPQPHAHRAWLELFTPAEKDRLGLAPEGNILARQWEALYAQAGSRPFLEKMLFLDQRTRMVDQYLVKVDRLSMANSLEVRVPLLDHRVVEFASRVPARQKIRGLTTKFLLRRLMEGRLPREVLGGAKRGFAPPLAHWLAGPLRSWAEALLAGPSGIRLELPRQMLSEHAAGRRDHHRRLWAVLAYLLWEQAYSPA